MPSLFIDGQWVSPESERLDAFRRVRDEIRWRISAMWPGSR